ncbi:metalloregulator ArsR/SmtB family transcription factor [Pseudonocardia sp. RS11V-5]|uniref:ArsR/SmtB family transcription factor n=1 Tax=Pseudonocardia terrae TaxID=2905831 RepID=UPI001E585859|nr:metalloregulator ArsR/SmtB family transcription factor [Pseudonocardia terrae]MCE3554626.1 metalloregulator ArsR/SmtB family transcription factor [Pseudonocardia terrae]
MNSDLAFDALADPVRREILAVLAETEECSSGALAERITSVGRTAVSSHLRVLKIAGLVSERRAGRFRYYSVDPSGSAKDVLAVLHQVFRTGLQSVNDAVPESVNDAVPESVNDGVPESVNDGVPESTAESGDRPA